MTEQNEDQERRGAGIEEPEGVEEAQQLEEAEQGAAQGPITLDRYLSRRRPPVRNAWSHMATLVAMLIGLLLIILYKDSCGQQAASVLGGMAPGQEESGNKQGVPVRYRAPVQSPASAPAKTGDSGGNGH